MADIDPSFYLFSSIDYHFFVLDNFDYVQQVSNPF